MAIFSRRDKYQKYKYFLKSLKILLPDGGGEIDIHYSRLIKIDLEENYEENFFPLFKLTLSLDNDTYYKLIQNKNKCQFFVRINKAYVNDDEGELSIEKAYINDTYDVILDENTGDMQSSLKKEANILDFTSIRKDTKNDLTASSDNMVSLYLFKSTIAGTKSNVNKVFANINVTDAIAYLMTVAKIDNVLMGQPDNNTVYPEFLLPPQSVLKSLQFIDTYYGIYRDGTMMYFGLDYTYIIPYNGKCVAYYSGEILDTTIVIPESFGSDYSEKLGSYSKISESSKNYIIGDYKTLNINNNSITNDFINANSIDVIDSYDAEDNEEEDSEAESKMEENFTKIYTNNTENQFIANMYVAQTNAQSDVVTVRLLDYDISALSPNKRIKLVFEDTEYTSRYNGEYILAGINSEFSSSGAEMQIASTVVLRRVVKTQ